MRCHLTSDPKPDLLRSYTKNIDGKRIIWNDYLKHGDHYLFNNHKENLIKNSNKISFVKVIIFNGVKFFIFIKKGLSKSP